MKAVESSSLENTYGPLQMQSKAPGVECPVCLVPIETDISLWSTCGHAFCRDCSDRLFRASKTAICPICRSLCSHRNVLRVAPQKKNNALSKSLDPDPLASEDVTLSTITAGSEWSIKIAALLRRLIALKKSAPDEKSLVFSQFPDALRVVSLALKSYDIAHVVLYGRGKVRDNMHTLINANYNAAQVCEYFTCRALARQLDHFDRTSLLRSF